MEAPDALRILGAAPGASWEEIRRCYREQLMSHHPDAAGGDDPAGRTEQIVEAFRALRTITDDGARPLPLPLQIEEDAAGGPMVLHAHPGDVFVRMCQAAERIGHLSYADRDGNILQVTIGNDDWAPAQLTAELTAEGALTMALFSLEALTTREAPPIHEVVSKLAESLRAPAAID
ncbi:MAG: J domain-containing protein [Actinomycetota bacterium]